MPSSSSSSTIVIVGAGQAGASCAARLRQAGFEGRVILAGEEPHPPYQRPPLSKKYLSGAWPAERLYLRPESYWKDQDIELRLATRARDLDPEAQHLRLGDEVLRYDALVLATGTRPRRLPGAPSDLDGLHVLRGLGDVARMRPAFRSGARLVVIGGGYVGLETAAVARAAGLEVTVIEAAPRLLARVACAETAEAFAALHRAQGVRLILGAQVTGLAGTERVRAVETAAGAVPADLVLVGIGATPETRLAQEAGLGCDDGIEVDAHGRTSAPAIWAAGDCARFPWRGERVRLENVQNAIDQAEAVADDILGRGRPYDPVPWFWSDQYDTKLQIAGLNAGHDRVVAVTGGAGRSHWYFRGSDLLAVDAIDDAKAFMTAKHLLAAPRPIDPEALTAPDFDPRDLLKAG